MSAFLFGRSVACAAILVAASVLSSARGDVSPPSPQIQYKFTVRDFVEALCMQKVDRAKYFDVCETSGQKLCWPKGEWNEARYRNCEWFPDEDLGAGHPDFEIHGNIYPNAVLTGIVNETLFTEHDGLPRPIYCRDSDAKPWCGEKDGRYATTGKSTFDQWYRDVPRVNKRVGITLDLDLEKDDKGKDVYVYDPKNFFPLTEYGFDVPLVWPLLLTRSKSAADFTATTQKSFGSQRSCILISSTKEAKRLRFGATMTSGCLSIAALEVDIGGLPPAERATVNLDNLKQGNLTKGVVRLFDIFHAERHTHQSNFRIETTLAKVCNVVESGTRAFDMSTSAAADVKLLGSAEIASPSKSIILTKAGDQALTGYAWIGLR